MAATLSIKEEPVDLRNRRSQITRRSDKCMESPSSSRYNNKLIGGTRKQAYPQPIVTEEDEMSAYSESDSDDCDIAAYSHMTRSGIGEVTACDWCQRKTTAGLHSLQTKERQHKNFCRQQCQEEFRGNHMRRKVCDWCGKTLPSTMPMMIVEPSSQSLPLQFCTDKCLNRYKMDLFCSEAKEQLQRIAEDNIQMPISSTTLQQNERKILITPELWSEGDSAVVQYVQNSSNSPLEIDLTVSRSSERKRKSNSMETVISKISKRGCNGPLPTIAELPTPSRHQRTELSKAAQPLTPATAMQSADKPIVQLTEIHTADSTAQSHDKLPKQLIAKSMLPPATIMIPFPFIIPVPIPIPIPCLKTTQKCQETNCKCTASSPNTHDYSNSSTADDLD